MASDATDRIVFDTNTLVSGYLFPLSTPGQAVEFGLRSHRILMSMEVVRGAGGGGTAEEIRPFPLS